MRATKMGKIAKRSLAALLMLAVLFSSAAFLPPVIADPLTQCETEESEFRDLMETLSTEKVGIKIPGLMEAMVPQGIAVTDEYVLISAYDSNNNRISFSNKAQDNAQDSVIYIMDKHTNTHLTTLVLDGNKCHVGGIAWNNLSDEGGVIFVADSSKKGVWRMDYSAIKEAVWRHEDVVNMKLDDKAFIKVHNTPSFLTYYEDQLYVGTFMKNKNGYLCIYDEEGKCVQSDLSLPMHVQGIKFVEGDDGNTYLFSSASYGRKKKGALYIHQVFRGQDTDGSERISFSDNAVGTMILPNMSEELDIDQDNLYINYESAADFYRNGLDGKGKSTNQMDCITISSVKKIFSLFNINSGTKRAIVIDVADDNATDEDVEYENPLQNADIACMICKNLYNEIHVRNACGELAVTSRGSCEIMNLNQIIIKKEKGRVPI